jgi:predicted Rossmann-fold nucleotide-binding protein
MRKFWFVYLAEAVVLFPGDFGTLDEMFEILTLVQTRKTRKQMPIVLFGTKYWDEVIKFDALVKYGTISAADLDIFHRTDSLDDAYDIIINGLTENASPSPDRCSNCAQPLYSTLIRPAGDRGRFAGR